MFQIKTLRNKKGFSITEVLVAAGLLSIISLGVATMLENMTYDQKRANLFATLRELKTKIEFNIKDQNAWNQTVQHMDACIRTGGLCTPAANPVKLDLYDATGAAAYQLLGWTDTTGNGFTETGLPCATFATAGDEACPISYKLVYTLTCLAATPCSNPQIRITGRLIFAPASASVLGRFAKLIPRGNEDTTGVLGADADSDNKKYDISIVRTGSMLNRNFRLAATNGGTGPGCATIAAGVGACSVGALAVHPMTFNVSVDNSGLVAGLGTRTQMRFTEVGYYSCTITVAAFATQGFQATLRNTSTGIDVASGATVAGYWSSAAAVIETKFNVADVLHVYEIFQRCDALPPAQAAEPNINNCTLGMNVANYSTPTEIVTMTCHKIDQTF